MDSDPIRSPLVGADKDLKILEDLGTGHLSLPPKEQIRTLVSHTALKTLEEKAALYHKEGKIEDHSYVFISAGIQQIRSQLFEERVTGLTTENELSKLYATHLEAAESFLSKLETIGFSEKKKAEITSEVRSLLDQVRKECKSKTPDIPSLLSKLQELQSTISAHKTEIEGFSSLTPPLKLSEIARGKAKIVLKAPNQPGIVFYQPVSGQKQKEIEQEVQTAKAITNNLYKRNLSEALGNSFSPEEKGQIISLLMEKYTTVEKLVHALNHTSQSDSLSQYLGSRLRDKNKGLFIEEQLLMRTSLEFLKSHTSDGEHLALNLEIVSLPGAENTFTVATNAADRDLEKQIRKRPANFATFAQLGLQFLKGMKDLHRAGFVQGDLKPENVLIYQSKDGTLNSKISDFGKTVPMDDKSNVLYSGNPRFAPPELRLSKPGEVYSSALILIRMVEESILDLEPLQMLAPVAETKVSTPNQERRGVEKFVCTNKFCQQKELTKLVAKVKLYGKSYLSFNNAPDTSALKAAEIEIHKYIGALILKLKTHQPIGMNLNDNKLEQLENLLKEMTSSNLAKRPSMEQVVIRYQEIIG